MVFGLFEKKDEKKPWDNPNHPVYSRRLDVPYIAKLASGNHMEVGQMVVIKGFVPEFNVKEEREPIISIALSTDSVREPRHVMFYMELRFKEKKVVLNSRDQGQWGEEVRKSLSPFDINEKFDVRIRAHTDKFEIDVNGKHYADFAHRLPLASVNNITVNGKLVLCQVKWGGKYYSIPYEAALTGTQTLSVGKALSVSVVPEKTKTGFEINLKDKDGNTVLHLNPRFKEKVFLRNSRKDGQWMTEEREGDFPFEKQTEADLVVVNEPYGFQIYVNDEFYCAFDHRLDPASIYSFGITGDVELLSVQVDDAKAVTS